MKITKPAAARAAGTVLLVLAAIGVAVGLFRMALRNPETRVPPKAEAPPPQPLVLEAEDVPSLTWERLEASPDIEAGKADDLAAVIPASVADAPGPVRYLAALNLAATGKPDEALDIFLSIPVADIPPTLLYAPYRLHAVRRPGTVNPYVKPLLAAVRATRVPNLIRARVLTAEGELADALAAYLKTDPAAWKTHDITCLELCALHAGLRTEVRKLAAGALRSGRVEGPLRAEVAALGSRGVEQAEEERQLAELKRQAAAGTLPPVAVASAARILETRELFVERKYADLLRMYAKTEPGEPPDETVLMLFLASAAGNNTGAEVYRWGQELKRRHPDKETADWVGEITTSVR